jgi:hypothetical protein
VNTYKRLSGGSFSLSLSNEKWACGWEGERRKIEYWIIIIINKIKKDKINGHHLLNSPDGSVSRVSSAEVKSLSLFIPPHLKIK